MKHTNNRKLKSFLWLSLLCVGVILCIHIAPKMGSMTKLNRVDFPNGTSLFEPVYLKEAIQYHKTNPVFSKRKITVFLIEKASTTLAISLADAFVLINYFLLFLHGILIYFISKTLLCSEENALRNILLYYVSFSIIFIFFPPIYSFDEPLHYFILLLTLLSFLKRYWFVGIVFLSLSCIVRESSLILLPFFVFYGWQNYKPKYSFLHVLPVVIVPCLVYLSYRIVVSDKGFSTHDELILRGTALKANFKNLSETTESLFSLCNTVIFPVVLLFRNLKKRKIVYEHKGYINSIKWILLFNSTLVLVGMLAKESRLFFLPMLLLVPFYYFIYDELQATFTLENFRVLFHSFYNRIIVIAMVIGCWVLSFNLFCSYFSLINEYCFLSSLVVAFYFLIELRVHRRKLDVA